jgi:uncharacterized membrane protein
MLEDVFHHRAAGQLFSLPPLLQVACIDLVSIMACMTIHFGGILSFLVLVLAGLAAGCRWRAMLRLALFHIMQLLCSLASTKFSLGGGGGE